VRRRVTLVLLAAAFGSLFLFPAFSAPLTDWWWFREIGYQVVFIRELTTRLLLFLAAGGLTAGVLYLNLRAAQRGLLPTRSCSSSGGPGRCGWTSRRRFAAGRCRYRWSPGSWPASPRPRPGTWCSR
jgi:Uncharacterised protein family (UPF0182)